MAPIDWQTGKTPLQCTKYMLEKELNCDVNFKVGENKENITAHKFILSMRSAVFDRMFNGSFCESEEDPVILDVPSAAFQMVLRYCYYECLDIEDDVALSVLYASTKYMLPLLEEAAREKLIEILNGSNIWDIYKYAKSVGDTELHDACKVYFTGDVKSVQEALQAEAFLNIPHQVLLDFLHINDKTHLIKKLGDVDDSKVKGYDSESEQEVHYCGIRISEIELFKVCNAWAEAECQRQEIDPTGANKRTVLGDVLLLIRFPVMLQTDLAYIVYPTDILTQNEIVNLCQYKNPHPVCEYQTDFPSSERQFVMTTPEPSFKFNNLSSLYVISEVRVMLSRVWVLLPGTYKVTVKDTLNDMSWSMKYDVKYQDHTTKSIGGMKYYLYTLDVTPQLFESGTRYSITAERTQRWEHKDFKHSEKNIVINGSSFKEVKIACDPNTKLNTMYALTLSLV